MDSLTQAALGAAVAEATFGRRHLGNKAILWGLALGTLPDLDIIAYPFLDTIGQLQWHRGFSHSLVFMVLASPLLGWMLAKIHRGKLDFARATLGVFLILFTHALIDVFTVYGTMIFEPFSDARISTDNFFIIDPLFTLPLLIGLVGAWFSAPDSRRRLRFNSCGLILATVYTLWSFGAKSVVHDRFDQALQDAGIPHTRLMSAPTPLNTLVWRGLAETEDAFWVGYFSLLQPGTSPKFEQLPKNHSILEGIGMERELDGLAWFSEGYFGVEVLPDGLLIRDWRFGEIPSGDGGPPDAIFSWKVSPNPDGPIVEQLSIRRFRNPERASE